MAIVPRFFSTAAAGAGDGTSWANRAQLHNAGTWSTVITGFAFNGSDSMQAFIGPGSYTISTNALAAGLFANPPTAANPLLFCGCDSSGVLLAIPDPKWLSCQPVWDDSTLPVLTTTTNIVTTSLVTASWFLVKFTTSGRTGAVVTGSMGLNWCVITNNVANTAVICMSGGVLTNSVLSCAGSSYDTVVSTPLLCNNCRLEGVSGSSGNRRGVTAAGTTTILSLMTVVNHGGEGVIVTSASTAQNLKITRSVIANNGAQGLKANSTASQTANYETYNCMITGNGTAGIDGNSNAARWLVGQNRLRDNTTDITGLGNYPIDVDNYVTDDSDANEYVSTGANGDFSIKNTATNVWNKGFGVRDQPADTGAAGIIGDGSSW